MYYLPLPGSPHTCVTSLVTALEKDYDMISNTFVLWNNKLVYGGTNLSMSDAKNIYAYLIRLSKEREAAEKQMEEEKRKKAKESDKVDIYRIPNISINNCYTSNTHHLL